MNKPIRGVGWIILAGITWYSAVAIGATNMVNDEKIICAGRLLISLPIETKAAMDSTYHYIKVEPSVPVRDFQILKEKIESRKEKYSQNKMQRSARDDALERRAGFDPDKSYATNQLVGFRSDDNGKQIILGYHVKNDAAPIITNLYKVVDETQYTFTLRTSGADSYPAASASLWSSAARFQPLPNLTQPHGPGFCVDSGMFADDSKPSAHESFALNVGFKNHPDVEFTVDADAIASPNEGEPSLKFRVGSELGLLRESVDGAVTVLVRGKREAAGQEGYEIGLSVPNDTVSGTTAYKFFWAADGVPNDVTRPFMEVQLTIQPDEDKPATIQTADAAKALWEELLQGIRIRPGAVRP